MLIPFPQSAVVLQHGKALNVPQNVLTSEHSGSRFTLGLGWARHSGVARVLGDAIEGQTQAQMIAEMQSWFDRMAYGDNWTMLPLGIAPAWPLQNDDSATQLTVAAVSASSVDVTYSAGFTGTRDDLRAALIGTNCFSKRMRQIATALDHATIPTRITLGFTPRAPLPDVGDVLTETSEIAVHFVGGDNARQGPMLIRTPDWMEPQEIPWIERIGG